MPVEGDEKKADANLKKHKVSFNEAATVFADPLAMSLPDPAHSVSERRFITMGVSESGRLLVVAHTFRGGTVRLITARKPTRAERAQYEEG